MPSLPESTLPEPLSYTKVCSLADFSHPELEDMLRDVYPYELDRFGPEFPKGAEYRKQWESAMSARALLAADVLGEDARALVVGAGSDAIVFWLTRHAGRVHAVDDYLAPGADPTMLADPSARWPSAWNPRRLSVENMKGTTLRFEDATFDAVVLPNGFPGAPDAYHVEVLMEEVYRVLKPGGVLTVATEFRVAGPRGAMPFPMFDEQDAMTHVVGRFDWEVLGAADLELDDDTIASAVSFAEVRDDLEQQRWTWSTYPHVVLVEGESAWTSVHLALRKAASDGGGLLRGRRPSSGATVASEPPTIAADTRVVDAHGRIVPKVHGDGTGAPNGVDGRAVDLPAPDSRRGADAPARTPSGGADTGSADVERSPTAVPDHRAAAAPTISRAELEAEPGERMAVPVDATERSDRRAAYRRGLLAATGLALVVAYPVGAVVLGIAGISGTPPPRLTSTVVMSVLLMLVFAFIGGSWQIAPHRLRHHVHEVLTRLRLSPVVLLPLALAAAVVITQPVVPRLRDRLLGDVGDAGVLMHLLEWQRHAILGSGSLLDPNVFALTDAATGWWNPMISGLLALYLPLRVALSPLGAFNALLVAATFATLLAAYAFVRSCGFNPPSAAVGALLYATTAQRLSQVVHVDTFLTFWIPLTALLLLRLFEERRPVDGALLGGVLALSLVTAPLIALGCAVLTLAFVGTRAVRDRRALPAVPLALTGGVAAVAWIPFVAARVRDGIPQGGDLVLPVGWPDLFHPGRAYLMRWLARSAELAGGGVTGENWLFSSLVLAFLAAAGAYLYWRRIQDGLCALPGEHPAGLTSLMGHLAVVGLVLSAGAFVSAGPLGVRLPLHAILWIPGLPIVRTSGPFMALAFLPLVILAAVAYRRMTERQPLGKQILILGVTALLILATTARIPPAAELDLTGEPTEVNRALAQREPGRVLELPWPACPTIDCAFTEPPRMLWSALDWQPRVNGASRYAPAGFSVDPTPMERFPDARSLDWLAEQEVRYVILRRSAGPDGAAFTLRGANRIADRADGMEGVASVEKIGADYLITLER